MRHTLRRHWCKSTYLIIRNTASNNDGKLRFLATPVIKDGHYIPVSIYRLSYSTRNFYCYFPFLFSSHHQKYCFPLFAHIQFNLKRKTFSFSPHFTDEITVCLETGCLFYPPNFILLLTVMEDHIDN